MVERGFTGTSAKVLRQVLADSDSEEMCSPSGDDVNRFGGSSFVKTHQQTFCSLDTFPGWNDHCNQRRDGQPNKQQL